MRYMGFAEVTSRGIRHFSLREVQLDFPAIAARHSLGLFASTLRRAWPVDLSHHGTAAPITW